MKSMIETSDPGADREVLISRTFHVPRELVWKAWTELEHLRHWHAPEGCEIEFKRFDFREGGEFLSCISNPSFGECWCLGTYLEIVVPERIVYTMAMADADGNLVSSAAAGHVSEWPDETTVTLTLAEADGGTLLTLRQSVSEELAKRTGAYPSWLSMLDRLASRVGS
ncbi:SRPBCC family protein [Luteolibacter soli]|uniref:SRPBCC domain-containing protein n=1 Tax=Luteolibacter soli TaxID=3135280 RepID=A0ABU9B1H7_9BACT